MKIKEKYTIFNYQQYDKYVGLICYHKLTNAETILLEVW